MSKYWIPVDDEMPKHRQTVLATYINPLGNRRVVVGYWLEKWKEVCEQEDDEDCCQYFEALDEFYYIEGWYEQQLNWGEYSSIYIHDGAITHWQSLPSTENLE